MTLRHPAVAGSFYPADPAELRAQIESCYRHSLGPGTLPKRGSERRGLRACVSPHAGYQYSGPVAAHSYLDIGRLAKPDLVVVVGPNHYGIGSGIATFGEGEWETPLGPVRTDPTATRRLMELVETVDVDPSAHKREHSIEVQLPFLQMLFGDFAFLPISLAFQDKATARELGQGLAKLLSEVEDGRRSAALIASSDLTHYEPDSQAREKDTALLKQVERLDLDGFYTTLERRDITACGYGAIATVMHACKALGREKGKLNAYHTSGEVTGERGAVVGYPSVSFI